MHARLLLRDGKLTAERPKVYCLFVSENNDLEHNGLPTSRYVSSKTFRYGLSLSRTLWGSSLC